MQRSHLLDISASFRCTRAETESAHHDKWSFVWRNSVIEDKSLQGELQDSEARMLSENAMKAVFYLWSSAGS